MNATAARRRPLAVAAPLAVALLARRPAYMLERPFWVAEAWVADSVRAPLGELPSLTSSTPIGSSLLPRLVPPIGGPQAVRPPQPAQFPVP